MLMPVVIIPAARKAASSAEAAVVAAAYAIAISFFNSPRNELSDLRRVQSGPPRRRPVVMFSLARRSPALMLPQPTCLPPLSAWLDLREPASWPFLMMLVLVRSAPRARPDADHP
jgi:TRAP-type C4-dicarboxylate transport system permease large subunit